MVKAPLWSKPYSQSTCGQMSAYLSSVSVLSGAFNVSGASVEFVVSDVSVVTAVSVVLVVPMYLMYLVY